MILRYLGALVYIGVCSGRPVLLYSTVYVIRLQIVCRQEDDKGPRLRRPPRHGGCLHCQPLLLLAPRLCLLLHVLCARLRLS